MLLRSLAVPSGDALFNYEKRRSQVGEPHFVSGKFWKHCNLKLVQPAAVSGETRISEEHTEVWLEQEVMSRARDDWQAC